MKMPRKLKFKLENNEIEAYLNKFTRDDVYGKLITERRDEEGAKFMQANLTSDGAHIIPTGGLGFDYIDPEGRSVSLSETKLLDDERQEIPYTKSMFKTTITLKDTIEIMDYFCYDIESTYFLEGENLTAIQNRCYDLFIKGKLLRFTYAWNDTQKPSDAILFPKEGKIIVAIGKYADPYMQSPIPIEYLEDEPEEEIEFDVW